MRRAIALCAAVLLACGAAIGKQAAAPDALHVPEIAAAALPQEARETLALIRSGGPFRHRQDGTIFGNRERRLPRRERGYYREFTMPTPGARDRGARRIVAGKGGEYYYTDDHYNSFRRIREY